MKMIGLIGGMSWESSAVYYRLLNAGARARLGGLASARLLLSSVDFREIAAQQQAGDWEGAGRLLAGEAARLEAAGAEILLLCTNTMHLCAPAILAALKSARFLHIGDVVAAAARAAGARRPLLLGTVYAMEQPFYREHLAARGVETVIPEAEERAEIHRIIFEELCRGRVEADARAFAHDLVARARAAGRCDGVILGCTELGLMLSQESVDASGAFPTLDTTILHVEAALDAALA